MPLPNANNMPPEKPLFSSRGKENPSNSLLAAIHKDTPHPRWAIDGPSTSATIHPSEMTKNGMAKPSPKHLHGGRMDPPSFGCMLSLSTANSARNSRRFGNASKPQGVSKVRKNASKFPTRQAAAAVSSHLINYWAPLTSSEVSAPPQLKTSSSHEQLHYEQNFAVSQGKWSMAVNF